MNRFCPKNSTETAPKNLCATVRSSRSKCLVTHSLTDSQTKIVSLSLSKGISLALLARPILIGRTAAGDITGERPDRRLDVRCEKVVNQPVSHSELHVVTSTVGRRPYKPVQPARVSWAISPVITSHPAVTVCAVKDGEELVNTSRTLSPPQLLTVLPSDVIDDVSTYPYYQGTSCSPETSGLVRNVGGRTYVLCAFQTGSRPSGWEERQLGGRKITVRLHLIWNSRF